MFPQVASAVVGIFLLGSTLHPSAIGALNSESADNEKNVLTNGAFENGTEGWNFHSFSSQGQASADPKQMRAGKPTVRIENSQADDSMLMQKVTVKPNTRYRLSGWIKTKDVGSMDARSTNGASLSVRGGFLKTDSISKDSGWKRVKLDFSTKAETEIEVGPRLGHHGAKVAGTAWFADLSLVELGPARR